MRIRVTQDHIDKGVPMQGEECPVAIAIKECTDLDPVVVGYNVIRGRTVNREMFIANSPQQVSDFVSHFDGSEAVMPFEFELNLEVIT